MPARTRFRLTLIAAPWRCFCTTWAASLLVHQECGQSKDTPLHINRNAKVFSCRDVFMLLATTLPATPLDCGSLKSSCSGNECIVSGIWFVIDVFALVVALYLHQNVRNRNALLRTTRPNKARRICFTCILETSLPFPAIEVKQRFPIKVVSHRRTRTRMPPDSRTKTQSEKNTLWNPLDSSTSPLHVFPGDPTCGLYRGWWVEVRAVR